MVFYSLNSIGMGKFKIIVVFLKVAVINQGIGGTLASGSGVSRIDKDVLALPGARYVIVLYGINDILFANAKTNTVISAYKQIITRAHDKNMLIYGGTLLPMGGYSEYNSSRENVRKEVNNWIRSTSVSDGGFDAVIDFHAALRDPNDPSRLNSAYDSGDHLHPNPAGYQKIGDTIDLSLLTR